MRVLKWRLAVLLCSGLAYLWRPVVRFCVRLAGRLGYWQSQAEICWLLSVADQKTQQAQRRGKAT